MLKFLVLAGFAVAAPAAAQQRSAAALPAAAQRDAQCLTLSLMAASVVKDDPDKMKTVIAESWYFLGRLDSAARSPDLQPILRPIAERLEKDGNVKEVGQECDKIFVARGAALRTLGQQSADAKP